MKRKLWWLFSLIVVVICFAAVAAVADDNYTVTFNYPYPASPVVVTVTSGQTVAEPTDKPTDPQKTFYAWGTLAEGQQQPVEYNFGSPVTNSFTLYPIWDWKVRFDNGFGETIATVDVHPGETVTAPKEKPTHLYNQTMEFDAWGLYGDPFDFETPITSDLTLMPLWKYQATFYKYYPDRNGYSPTDYVYVNFTPGETIEAPTLAWNEVEHTSGAQEREFCGWTYDDEVV